MQTKTEISPFTLQNTGFAFELNNSYWTVSLAFDYIYYAYTKAKLNGYYVWGNPVRGHKKELDYKSCNVDVKEKKVETKKEVVGKKYE